MARPINITPKNLRELQKAMKYMETAIEPRDVTPILADALQIFKAKALELLKRLTKRAKNLPDGWEHIEDALVVQEGKSTRIARAFSKVFRRASPQAIWIEFGHRMVKGGSFRSGAGRQIGFVTANPFFRPAINITRPEMLKTVRVGVKGLLQKAADKAGFKSGQSGTG